MKQFQNIAVNRFLISLLLVLITTTVSQANQPKALHTIVIDLGFTVPEEDKKEREEYSMAFINLVYKSIYPRPNEQVVIISAFGAKPVWTGNAIQFKQGAAGLREKIIELDHIQGGTSYRNQVPVDLVRTFAAIKQLEHEYSSIEESHLYFFSPMLDTETVIQGMANVDYVPLIAHNKSKLTNVIKLPGEKEHIKLRSAQYFWVHHEIKPIIKHLYETTSPNTQFRVLNIVESRTELFRYIEQ